MWPTKHKDKYSP